MKTEASAILKSNRYATISTVDTNGNPWAAPVWYVIDEDSTIYWWSPVSSQHSKNIESNSNVYITIFDSTVKEGEGLGLYMKASAVQITGSDIERVAELYNKSTTIFKLDVANCTASAPTRLYKAVPSELWVNRGKEDGEYYEDYRELLD